MWLTLIALFSGFVAGLIHVYTGPDHLSAIAPLAAARRRGGWRVGLMWGLGHSTGVWLLTLLVLLLGELFPLEFLSSWSERLVGLVLIGVGAWGLHRALRVPVVRAQEHDHEHEQPTRLRGAAAIGLLHGLAGSSHLVSALPVLAVTGLTASLGPKLGYALGFGLAAILAMSVFGWVAGMMAVRTASAGLLVFRRLLGGCAMASIGVGCWWLFDGIRTALPV